MQPLDRMNAIKMPFRAVPVAVILSSVCLTLSAVGPLPADEGASPPLALPEGKNVGEPLAWLPGEAARLLAVLATNHPGVAASASDYAAARADALSIRGFYQPQTSFSAGLSRGPNAAPESSLASSVNDDAMALQGGVLLPLRSGAYVGLGLAQRRLENALDDDSSCGQSLAGVRLSVPLLRDRGFAVQAAREESADADAERMVRLCATELQTLGHGALIAFATELYASASLQSTYEALNRVQVLLKETTERVELKTTAEYQVFPAEMEVAFRRDDVRRAEAVLTNAHHRLELAVGGVRLPLAGHTGANLRAWAEQCLSLDAAAIAKQAGGERPEITAARQALASARAAERGTSQATRSSLSLTAGVGYQAENENGGFGNDNLLRDDRVGADIALVWSRPLSFDAEDAACRAARARTVSAGAALRNLQIAELAQQREAMTLLVAARERLALVDGAVESARRALAAETQRLRLGEGRSRNVLDAQNDLTSAVDRANLAAYDLVCAFTDVMLAYGVPLYPRIQIGDGNGSFRTLD